MRPNTGADTHEVTNQSRPLVDFDLYAADRPLQEAMAANGNAVAAEREALSAFGRRWGSADMLDDGRLANENPPKLRNFDAKGHRIDVVEFHPSYHRLMAESIGTGLHVMTWQDDGTPASTEVARAARFYMVAQVENGHMCPITMTRAAVAALTTEPTLLELVMPKLASRRYDPILRPLSDKVGATLGMGMTEKQGGTDVRANTTWADPDADGYRLTGHKWFLSAPMCDAFLVLAQAPGGLTCFFLPRICPDGTLNGLRLQRLKDKLGNRSNASAEVEFAGAFAQRVGEEGRGVRTILQMVQLTRLDCAVASAGIMRMALAQALHHARHRSVFGRPLAAQPMMRSVLADMALEVEGAVALVMRLCRSFDLGAASAREAARSRLLTPAVKYWICKAAPAVACEAMECLGGNGYVEDGTLARLYREAPVNAIWEGSGNVVALDVLRALAREGDAARDVLDTVATEAAGLPGAAASADAIARILHSPAAESHARFAIERLALLAAAAALRESAPEPVAAAFARARLAQSRGALYGASMLDEGACARLISRALPDM